MCRILKSKLCIKTFLLLALIGLSVFLFSQYAICLIIILPAIYIDKKTSYILSEQTSYAYGKNMIRNVDLLVIGDMIDVSTLRSNESKIVSILTPNKSLGASFWILKRMFSIIDEDKGKIIIAIKKENSNRHDITLFDYSFISPIHRKMMKIESMEIKRKHPLFYSPINALRLFLNIKYKKSYITGCPMKEIEQFCETRNIKFEYREI